MADEEEWYLAYVTVGIRYKSKKPLSTQELRKVAANSGSAVHVLGFEGVKEVTLKWDGDRILYAHHHIGTGCRRCYEQGQDGNEA